MPTFILFAGAKNGRRERGAAIADGVMLIACGIEDGIKTLTLVQKNLPPGRTGCFGEHRAKTSRKPPLLPHMAW